MCIRDRSYTVTQADLDAGKVVNTAKASAVYDGEEITDNDSITLPAIANPSLKVTKSADVESYNEVGQVINYTITVKNTGNVTLTDIVVIDPKATITGGSPIAGLAPGALSLIHIFPWKNLRIPIHFLVRFDFQDNNSMRY